MIFVPQNKLIRSKNFQPTPWILPILPPKCLKVKLVKAILGHGVCLYGYIMASWYTNFDYTLALVHV